MIDHVLRLLPVLSMFYVAGHLSYLLVQLMNSKFHWWNTRTTVLNLESPNSRNLLHIKNRVLVNNWLLLTLCTAILMVVLVEVWIVDTMRSYKLTLNYQHIPSISPVPAKFSVISSAFGERLHPLHHDGRTQFHEGADFKCPVGTPVVSPGAGKILDFGYSQATGNWLEIAHGSFQGRPIITRYFHLSDKSKRLFVKNKVLARGELVAFSGKTGRVTGAHLHYEVRVGNHNWNPTRFVRAFDPKAHDQLVMQFLPGELKQSYALAAKVAPTAHRVAWVPNIAKSLLIN